MKNNPIFSRRVPQTAKGYSAFPMDDLLNFTSVCGYLLPVYWDFLEPGDKVTCQTKLRTRTQPFDKPAMATICERIEWFAVPIEQLYKQFGTKFYGINDVSTDLLPTSGYNNYIPWVSLDTLDNYLNLLPTSPAAQSALPFTTNTVEECKRLFDLIGLPTGLGGGLVASGDSWKSAINVLPFAAYQKIYYDHFRLTDREVNDPEAYNLDSLTGAGTSTAEIQLQSTLALNTRLNKLLRLRKRPYMRDYFTSMQVSPLMGSADVNAAGNDLGAIKQWLTSLSSVQTAIANNPTSLPSGGGSVASNSEPTTVRIDSSSPTGSVVMAALNPANIRSLFAVEKLLEVTRRAKKHYDMQTLAHFGVQVPKGLAGECFKLGTHEQYIQIGDVVSTSDTATTGSSDGKSLGALAGTGASNGTSEKVHFEAKSHCILMAIYSAEPIVNNMNWGTDRKLSRTQTDDFYKSEFDNLGMQPVFKKELLTSPSGSGSDPNNVVLGWNYRYYEQKSRYNRSTCGCAYAWFNDWSLNRSVIQSGTGGLSLNFFFVWPTDLNNILHINYDGNQTLATCYYTDYFINQIYFDVVKSTKKSIYGEPNF